MIKFLFPGFFSFQFACRSIATGLALLICHAPAFAQGPVEPTQPSFSGSMGSVTVDGQQLYRLSFRPDIPIGAWGMALDVELFLNEEGNFSDRGWEFGTTTEAIDTFLRKLYYLRYGRPDQDRYLKIGALDQLTLGYGLIMNGYRNTLQYPGLKKTGLQFRFQNIGAMKMGFEGVINNFQDFQEGGALLGLRTFARPVGKLEIGLTYVVDLDQYGGLRDGDGDGHPDVVDAFPEDIEKALDNDGDKIADEVDTDDDNDGRIDIDAESGLSSEIRDALEDLNAKYGDEEFSVDREVARKNPFNKNWTEGDSFGIFGVDMAYPIVEGKHLNLKVYAQLAWLMDDDDERNSNEAEDQGVTAFNKTAEGMGIAAPGLWLEMGPLNGQIEFRSFGGDFDSGYFDNLYEIDRARLDVTTGKATPKDALLGRDEQVSGVFGRLGADLGQLFYASADYQYLTGADATKQQLHASASLSPNLLQSIPRLTQARAYYQKNNIGAGKDAEGTGEDSFLDSTEDTFYGYEVGLEMTGGVSLLWDARFVFERNADGHLERKKITTIETVFNF